MRDASQIKSLINQHVQTGVLLPVGIFDIYGSLRDFLVCEEESTLVGVCSVKIVWEDLIEIRSLAVDENHMGKGIGSALVENGVKEAFKLGVEKVFTLTTSPVFFSRIGFKEISKEKLPHKIWHDCVKCVKFPNCDEVAMLRKLEA